MKNILYIVICLLAASSVAFGQQEGQFTHFMYNQQAYNPAFVGSRNTPSFTFIYRKQWLDFDGAPESFSASFATPFANKSSGLGIHVQNQKIGLHNNWNMSLAYSYRLKISETLSLRIGLQGAGQFYNVDFTDPRVNVFDRDDQSIQLTGDPAQFKFNAGGGFYLYNKKFYIGASTPYFLSSDIGFNTDVDTTATSVPHIYGMGGVLLDISSKVMLRPALLVKYVQGAPFDLDANLSLIFNNKVSVGASYRMGGTGTGESIDFLLFLQVSRRMGLGLAYDFTISDLKDYNTGTFEALLRFDLKSERDDLENPRFFL